MANPNIPGIPRTEQDLLYQKLSVYNSGRTSYKEVGAYLVALPRYEHPAYSLWIYSPLPEHQSIFYICDLSEDVHDSLRIASTLCFYSQRPLYVVEYNAKRMQSKGDDLVFFGKYRGHFLHEVLRIDPAYLSWIAFKFEPRIPKQERFVQIARIYHSVHLDVQRRKSQQQSRSSFLGKEGDKVENLKLTVQSVHIEDNPYKTQVIKGIPHFYVRQMLKLKDAAGNLVTLRINARTASTQSCLLPALEHAYQPGETVEIASARIARTYLIGNIKCTRLNYVKLR
ncbi:hypothetical protein Q3C19_01685 [Bacteroides sp. ET489]|jgi:hypothetical protein|uniref:exodeoxyribonuclease X C-terminal domain-containing protein n=1 Tax=Bacteroides TaxID=816 RepID=UPI0008DAE08D|nr:MULTISPECIES: hypothetical protein [Bacteroides]MDO3389179.1 hypothetical protein [Bacteroides sp. ET489]